VPVPIADEAFRVAPWSPDFTLRMTCRYASWGGPTRDHEERAVSNSAARIGKLAAWRAGIKHHYRQKIRPWLPAKAQQWVARSKRITHEAMRRPAPVAAESTPLLHPTTLELSGLVYTSIFNPADDRKNPHDLITAFLLAFRDRPDVTLVLKLATKPDWAYHHVAQLRQQCLQYGIEHQCRVVVIADYLSEDELLNLFRATTFYVNTSRAEGACLPLQQALACGRPAIAPAQTAMADFIDDRVGFVVASHPEPTHWPHDPEKRIETTWQRLVWSSLRDQYLRSAQLASSNRAGYEAMSASARSRMQNYATIDVVTAAFRSVINQLGDVQLGSLGWEAERVA
jgi:glycosyltransferase involved in cell wall biosynthesis